jgi:hypothetical protein
MEFLFLASRYIKQPERERVVMQAVIEAAEAIGVDRVVMRRGNVYSSGVYLKDGENKVLLYNDWDKDWDWRRIFDTMIATVRFSPNFNQIILTA